MIDEKNDVRIVIGDAYFDNSSTIDGDVGTKCELP
jgi:hypothetical protein